MKHMIKTYLAIGSLAAGLLTDTLIAAESEKIQQVDSVSLKGGILSAVAKGQSFAPTNTVGLPMKIMVLTNMTFKVNDGPARELKEGQTLRKDGMLLSADGSLVPVVDHIAMLEGKPVLVQNGKSEPVTSMKTLANGTKILPDGTIVESSGERTRLLDGQLFKLSGSIIPSVDTVTFKGGKVVIQSGGSKINLPAGRTFMMENGTKVFSDGKMVYFDGKTRQLKDGETVEVTGVRRIRR